MKLLLFGCVDLQANNLLGQYWFGLWICTVNLQ